MLMSSDGRATTISPSSSSTASSPSSPGSSYEVTRGGQSDDFLFCQHHLQKLKIRKLYMVALLVTNPPFGKSIPLQALLYKYKRYD